MFIGELVVAVVDLHVDGYFSGYLAGICFCFCAVNSLHWSTGLNVPDLGSRDLQR